MRNVWWLVALLLLGCGRRSEPEPIWIGHLAGLSGPNLQRGEDAVRTLQAMLQDDEGIPVRIAGRQVMIRHVDAVEPRTARAEAVRLCAVNRVTALLVGPGLESAGDLDSVARSQGVPALFLEDDPEEEGEQFARFACEQLGRRKAVVVVEDEQRFGRVLAERFRARWRALGGTLVEQRGEQDAVVLLAMSSRKAEEYLADGKGARGPVLVAGSVGRTFSFPIREEVYTLGPYAAGAKLIEAGQSWARRFKERTKLDLSAEVVLAHDGMAVLMQALGQAEGPTRKGLTTSLEGMTDCEGLLGTLRQRAGRWRRPLVVVRHHEGKRTVVETMAVSAE